MTEQEYDEQIAPVLLDLATKVGNLGGSMVARVEWAPNEGGTTRGGDWKSSVSMKLAYLGAMCNGNLDKLVFSAEKYADTSQTIIGYLMKPITPEPNKDRP